MNPEHLALCTARAKKLCYIPGGRPTITAADIAAALSGLGNDATDYALAKYCLDYSARHRVTIALVMRVWKLMEREKWMCSLETAAMLAAMTLSHVIDHGRCSKCGGSGQVKADKVESCKRCEGTGFYRPRTGGMIEILRIPYNEWYRRWKGRYYDVMQVVMRWEFEIDKRVLDEG